MSIFYATKQVLVSIVIGLTSFAALADDAKVTPVIHKELDGLSNKEGVMLIVEYGPGMSSKKHRHDAHAFVYVLEGEIAMQVAGGDLVKLGAGDTFYESPNDVHLISKNVSNTETAKFLVFSLKEKNSPVVIPVELIEDK